MKNHAPGKGIPIPKTGKMARQAMLLTASNLALRMISMGFGVYLSGRVGASGVGLLQLTMSVCTLAMTAGMAGIRTATMYLTAGALGRQDRDGLSRTLTVCCGYSLLCSSVVGMLVFVLAPWLAQTWIREPSVVMALRVFASFLPVTCLVGVLTGYYTALGRVRTLVAVELAEQGLSMTLTVLLLQLSPNPAPAVACACVIGGSSGAGLLTLLTLWLLKGRWEGKSRGEPVLPRLLPVAAPLALADLLRMGISTLENLIVPRRLALLAGSEGALAAYGQVVGMVFPVLMFPACILWSLAELLIPELSRCAAGGKIRRIDYLTRRSLRTALFYGMGAAGLLFVLGEPVGVALYDSREVGRLLRLYAPLVPMLYLDAVVDAVIKGMGQQVASVRYNILTNSLDVVLLWLLLPRWGLQGYYLSFALTHVINFFLSYRKLRQVTGNPSSPERKKRRPKPPLGCI